MEEIKKVIAGAISKSVLDCKNTINMICEHLQKSGHLKDPESIPSTARPQDIKKMQDEIEELRFDIATWEKVNLCSLNYNENMENLLLNSIKYRTGIKKLNGQLRTKNAKLRKSVGKLETEVSELKVKNETQYQDFVNAILQQCEDEFIKKKLPAKCCQTCTFYLFFDKKCKFGDSSKPTNNCTCWHVKE